MSYHDRLTPYEKEVGAARSSTFYAGDEHTDDESRILDARFYLLGQRLDMMSEYIRVTNQRMDALLHLALADPYAETGAVSEWGDS